MAAKRASETRWYRLLLLSFLVGIVAGIGAILFNWMVQTGHQLFLEGLAQYRPPTEAGEGPAFGPFSRLLIPLVTGLGGLIAGWLVFTFAPEAEGHGTDAVIRSYHEQGGYIRPQVPVIKTLASAITLGSGGSGGREGPIAQIGAGLASVTASWLKLSDTERRILVMAGAGGGIGAVFHAPLGGALFAAEVLYSKLDSESEVLIPSIISAVTAYSVAGYVSGYGSLFSLQADHYNQPEVLPFYLLLAPIAAGAAWLFVKLFYGTQAWFKRLELPLFLKPALGGFLTGVLGALLPQVLSGGYGWIQMVFENKIPFLILILMAFGKMVATSLTIGSGGSGGVFGPSVFIGAALGGAYGQAVAALFPGLGLNPVDFALVGMASFFAAAAKTPLSTIVMVTEMTGGYGLLVPLMLSSFTSFILLRPEVTLYRSQVPERIDSPVHAHEYIRLALQSLAERGLPIPKDVPLPQVARLLETGQPVPLDPDGNEIAFAMQLEEGHPWVGRRIVELGLPPDVLVISVLREKANRVIVPRGHTRLEAGDTLILVGPPEAPADVERLLGENGKAESE